MSLATVLVFFFVTWACWRLHFRRRFLRTVLDVVPGPPGQSWISGEDHCFQGWILHVLTRLRLTRPADQSGRMGIPSSYR